MPERYIKETSDTFQGDLFFVVVVEILSVTRKVQDNCTKPSDLKTKKVSCPIHEYPEGETGSL